MKVFKFGGASLKDAQSIENVASIIEEYSRTPLLVVVSAIGKTTNELEKVVEHFYRHQRETAAQLLYGVQDNCTRIARKLLANDHHPLFQQLQDCYAEMAWQLGNKAYAPYDYYYDQLVSRGELISSMIVHAYLEQRIHSIHWLDVRDALRTDNTYRDGRIQWEVSRRLMTQKVLPLFKTTSLVITQGFIASTDEGKTTTLGREGSDFSAALFANMLDAESLTIWKDVEGLKNADPRLFDDTRNIGSINFNEVIEMAYYGAKVIHPKTIKPLQNKNIPLYVKCFLNKSLPGTVINGANGLKKLPPLIVLKKQQVLITVTTKDFSFISEENLSRLYTLFHELKIKLNLMQTGAISCSFCIDQRADKIERLIKALHPHFKIDYDESLEILTIRYYEEHMINQLTAGKQILLEQKSPKTLQLVMR